MMYYLVADRPLQSFLGILIMVSGLLIYAIFRKRDAAGSATSSPDHPGSRIEMFQTMKIAAVAAAMILAASPGARAAETVTADDTARFLAGLPPSANSPLMPLTRDAAWQHHARFFDTAFAQLEQRQLSKIRAWSAANLAAPRPTMFYMFSGPDFLYADAFYSKATTYVLSALEPPGSVPDLTQIAARWRWRCALQCRAFAWARS